MISRAPMMTRRGLRRYDCCPGHNPASYDHGCERSIENREWRSDPDTQIPARFQPGHTRVTKQVDNSA
ncbi:hypothetical protein [Streptomyces californicus]|uniref:hypothetical protein n=1 Tax=Streptomyces californicus TaxID=67351 RepID=UPI0033FCACBB